MITPVETTQAPAAIGPYAQAVQVDGWVYCSGQLGLEPATGALIGDATGEARQALCNLRAVLAAAGCKLSDVVKTTVYVTNLADFVAVNAVYAAAFADHRPARACVQVAALPKGGKVEIDAVARRPV